MPHDMQYAIMQSSIIVVNNNGIYLLQHHHHHHPPVPSQSKEESGTKHALRLARPAIVRCGHESSRVDEVRVIDRDFC
jgi:hypothetical protein